MSQALNSAGNFLLAVLVARPSSPAEYGAWAIAYLVYVMAVGVSRAVSAQPLLLSTGGPAPRSHVSGAITLGLGVGLVGSATLLAMGLLSESLRASAWALAPFIPMLCAIDTARSALFQRLKGSGAASVDGTWLAVQGGISAWLIATGADSAATLTIGWGIGGLAGLVLGCLVLHVRPTIKEALEYAREKASTSTRLLVDQTLMSARIHITPVVVASVSGLAAAGSLRAGLTLMGAIGSLVLAISPIATIEAVRTWERGSSPWPSLIRWAAFIFLAALVNGAVFLLLPDNWGQQLLGDNWGAAQAVLLPLVLHSLLRGPMVLVPTMLKASRALNALLWLRFRIEAVSLVVPVTGAILYGAPGAAWGLAASAALENAQCFRVMRRETRASWSADPVKRGVGSR